MDMCVSMYVYICMCVHVCVWTCVFMYVRVCVCVCVCVCISAGSGGSKRRGDGSVYSALESMKTWIQIPEAHMNSCNVVVHTCTIIKFF